MLSKKLQEENQKLWDKISALEDEIKDLKFQISASDLIIAEYENKIQELKAENRKLLSKNSNSAFQNSTEINNRPPLVPNARGAGRKSRVDEKTLNLIKSLKEQGFSHRQIAEKLTQETKTNWSKSTVSYMLLMREMIHS